MKYIFIASCLLMTNMLLSQNKFSELITLEGDRMEKAMLNEDYATIVDYTYPELLNIVGGREKLLQMIAGGIAQMKGNGITYKEFVIGSPGDLYTAGTELHCILPQKIVLETPDGLLESTTYLLAVSQDEGKTWYFLDVAQLTPDRVQGLFPNFNPNLTLPEKGDVKFIPNQE